MENKLDFTAIEIAKEITEGKRGIFLVLDKDNDKEPFVTFLQNDFIEMGLVEIIKVFSIQEAKEWTNTSSHKYNNEIRKKVLNLL
jgi:hypothetical protein